MTLRLRVPGGRTGTAGDALTLRLRVRGGAVARAIGVTCAHVLLYSQLAYAGVVTMTVTTPSGSAAENAVIVFDPLDASPPPSHDTAVIDQISKRYVPRVSVVRVGTAITFPNHDRIRHQVYSFSPAKPFNLNLYSGSPKVDVIFDKPGLVVLGCNIHDTMVAFVGVVETPYFAKVPASGTVGLNLPAGRYRLRVWHADLSTPIPPRQVDVAAAPLTIPVTVQLAAAGDSVAAWPE